MTPFLHTARFFITAAEIAGLPPSDLPEIAFVGRSNAGKSTCINTLTQQKRLAFASKTPGRTQQINYFALGFNKLTSGYLVDLPGYGYAAVSKTSKARWQQFLADYLRVRTQLTGLILITDSRIGLTPLDLSLLDFMSEQGKPVHVLASKIDKLNGSEARNALSATEKLLSAYMGDRGYDFPVSAQSFSALSKKGLDDLSELVHEWMGAGSEKPA